ncbi:POU domain, class 4, transcription factor 3 [Sceloporus undulatus]|uniref:POU domain, class 4, transcription factor 3 n=1 Tax=Sceloporus undulatus TaxID=8520 RepID=UPI001C4C12BC|nr:POU domain, class 4, transcription factor 3 [Sceloporus undulatus]
MEQSAEDPVDSHKDRPSLNSPWKPLQYSQRCRKIPLNAKCSLPTESGHPERRCQGSLVQLGPDLETALPPTGSSSSSSAAAAMLGLNAKGPFGLPPAALHEGPSFPAEAFRRACLAGPQLQGHIFGGGFEESLLLVRAEALAAAAEYQAATLEPPSSSLPSPSPGKAQGPYFQAMNSLEGGGGGGDLLEHLSPSALLGVPEGLGGPMPAGAPPLLPPALAGSLEHPPPPPPAPAPPQSPSDPRELEAFAERFKQRRIKLGVTQADVGAALASLKLPGVGSLSQSTICRFESLTLSANNMLALQPVLHAWLREAEAAHRETAPRAPEGFPGAGAGGPGLGLERKRKRTSIAVPEKRSLEAYFALQPRPSSEKIAAIAEKLELKKNVVRVWFCNQRQKQKRMKYAAGGH